MKLLPSVFLIVFLSVNVFSQNTKVEKDVEAFFDGYAADLREHRREAIVARYDKRGVYFLGNGWKDFSTFAEVKDRYLNKWNGPKSFAWKDMTFEVIGPNAVLAIGKFEWQSSSDPKPLVCSYSGLVLRSAGQWRIRVEDESCPPPK